jgi:hypothetical protein
MPQRLLYARPVYLVCVSDFCWSGEEPELAPLPAVPLDEGVALDEDDAPPLDWLFSSELEDGLEEGDEEPDGEDDIEPEAEPELDGEDGVVAPLEDDEPDGELDGLVLEDEPVADLPPPPLSHAASRLAPNAMETAIARVDNLMGPPWLGLLWG